MRSEPLPRLSKRIDYGGGNRRIQNKNSIECSAIFGFQCETSAIRAEPLLPYLTLFACFLCICDNLQSGAVTAIGRGLRAALLTVL